MAVSGVLETLTFEQACTPAEDDLIVNKISLLYRCIYGNASGVCFCALSAAALFIFLEVK